MASNVILSKRDLLSVRESTARMESQIPDIAKKYYPMVHPGRLTKIQSKAIIAAERGETLVLKFILSSTDVTAAFKFRWCRDPDGPRSTSPPYDVDSCCTLLHVACYYGQPAAAIWLIEAGALTMAPTALGWFPETAVAMGWEEMGEDVDRSRYVLILEHLLYLRINDPLHMPSWSTVGSTPVISKHASDVIGRGALTRTCLFSGEKSRALIDSVEPLDVTPDDVIAWQRDGLKGPDPRGRPTAENSYFDFKDQKWIVRTMNLGDDTLTTLRKVCPEESEASRDPEVDPTTVTGPDPVALDLLLQKSIDETEHGPESTVVITSDSPETSSDEDGYLTLSDAELAKLVHTCDGLGLPIVPPREAAPPSEPIAPPRGATTPPESHPCGDRARGTFRCPTRQEQRVHEGTLIERLANLERVMDLYNEFFQDCFQLQARLMVNVHLPYGEDTPQPQMGSGPAPDGDAAAP